MVIVCAPRAARFGILAVLVTGITDDDLGSRRLLRDLAPRVEFDRQMPWEYFAAEVEGLWGRHAHAHGVPGHQDPERPVFHPAEEPSDHADEHAERGGHDAHHGEVSASALAIGMVSVVVFAPILIAMSLSPGALGYLTLKMIDTFVSIFIAILWFNVFAQVIETFDLRENYPMATEIVCLGHVFVLFAIAVVGTRFLQDDEVGMTTFSSCGAHYIAFSTIGAGGRLQETMSNLAPAGAWGAVVSFAFCVALVAMIGLWAATLDKCLLGRECAKTKSLRKAVDEMEMDIIGLVASFLITQGVRQCITGKHPGMSHLQLQSSPDAAGDDGHAHGGHHDHAAWMRLFMLGWAVILTLVAVVAVPRLERMTGHNRKAHKAIHFLKVLLIMLVAWGYLLWGQWLFFETMFHGDSMYAHMVFALLASSIGFVVLYMFAGALTRRQAQEQPQIDEQTQPQINEETSAALRALQGDFRRTATITVTGISLVIAWSWEHCFNLAFDIIGDHYSVGFEGLVPKFVMAIIIPCCLLPTYIIHIKPRVLGKQTEYEPDSDSPRDSARISSRRQFR